MFKSIAVIFMVISTSSLGTAVFIACSEQQGLTDQTSGSPKTKKLGGSDSGDRDIVDRYDVEATKSAGVNAPIADFDADSAFVGGFDTFEPSSNENLTFWIPTKSKARVYYYKASTEGKVEEKKMWTGLPGAENGTRVSVLERAEGSSGAVFIRQGGHIAFVESKLANGTAIPKANMFKLTNVDNETRGCSVSYRKSGKRYLGVGYGKGWFVEIPQSDKAPYAPLFAQAKAPKKIHNNEWGYSCYIDRNKMTYYGQYRWASDGLYALNLKTMSSVSPQSVAANKNVKPDDIAPDIRGGVNITKGRASYILSGDKNGNVFNNHNRIPGDQSEHRNQAVYTTVHETFSNTLWVSYLKGDKMKVYPHGCALTNDSCPGMQEFSKNEIFKANGIEPPAGTMTAMAKLGDRYVLMIIRDGESSIALLSLKNPKSIADGIRAKLIDRVPDHVYTYNDYTGATLYKAFTKNEIDLAKGKKWEKDQPIKAMSLLYDISPGANIDWKNIAFSIRCFQPGQQRPPFEKIAVDAKALKQFAFSPSKTCINKTLSQAEVMFESIDGKNDLDNITKIQITAFQ